MPTPWPKPAPRTVSLLAASAGAAETAMSRVVTRRAGSFMRSL
jgi:hypothetical protein